MSAQSCPTLCDPMDCNLPGFSVPGILQARILERVAMPSSRGSSWRKGWPSLLHLLNWQADFFFFLITEPPGKCQTENEKDLKGEMVSILMDKPFCKSNKNKIKQKQRLVKHLNSEVETETEGSFATAEKVWLWSHLDFSQTGHFPPSGALEEEFIFYRLPVLWSHE